MAFLLATPFLTALGGGVVSGIIGGGIGLLSKIFDRDDAAILQPALYMFNTTIPADSDFSGFTLQSSYDTGNNTGVRKYAILQSCQADS